MIKALNILGIIEIIVACVLPFAFPFMLGPAALVASIAGIIGGALLIGFAKLIEEAGEIRKNTRSTADYFEWLRKRQQEQTNRPPAPSSGARVR
jgi:hypothetical protein